MKGNFIEYNDDFEKSVVLSVAETFTDLMMLNEVNEYDVADETGIDFDYLEQLATGDVISVGVWELYQLSEYFNVSIDELLRRG